MSTASPTPRPDGGPAFGGAYDEVFVDTTGQETPMKLERRVRGISVRDYFAAQALGHVTAYSERFADQQDALPVESIARLSYAIADAMLAERAK